MTPTPTDPREERPESKTPRIDAAWAKEADDELWREGAERVVNEARKIELELNQLKETKRPFSDKLADEVIKGQVKRITDLETSLATLRAELEAQKQWRNEAEGKLIECGREIANHVTELEAARKERDEIKAVLFEKDAAYEQESPMLRPTKASVVSAFARLQTDRDTALAAKDAAEKRVAEALPIISDALNELSLTLANTERREDKECRSAAYLKACRASDLITSALTPAPTQEPTAGGVTISNDSSLPKAGNNAETREGIVPAPSDGLNAIARQKVLFPRDDREQVGQATPDVRPVPAVTSSTSPADVPSEGRGELLPFNLSDALAGKPVVTRDGKSVTGFKEIEHTIYPVFGHIGDSYAFWTKKGEHYHGIETDWDLFMLPTEGSGA